MQLDGVQIDSLYLSTASIAQMLRDYHASGAIQHNRVVAVGSRIFEFTVGAVRDVSIDHTVRRGSGRRGATAFPLRAMVPVAFNCRAADVLADAGTNGFALIHVAMVFELPVHRGAVPKHLYDHIRIDCTPTDAGDITLFGLKGADAAEIAGILVQFVHRYLGGTYPIPPSMGPLASANEPTEVVTYAEPVQMVALRPALPKPEALAREIPPEIAGFAAGNSWAAFLSAASLDREMVKLAYGVRGILEGAGGAAKQNVEVAFEDGFLRVLSSPRSREGVRTSAPAKMRIGLSMTGSGAQGCTARQLDPAGSYASEDAERRICGLVSSLLSPLSSARGAAGAAEPQSARVLFPEIRRNGVVFHGVIDQLEAFPAPLANFRYLRVPSSRTQFVFNALSSGSPGCEIAKVAWNFGDGVTASSTAADLAFVVTHSFETTGDFHVVLRVTDSLGRVATHGERVPVGRVTLEIGSPVAIGPNRYRTAVLLRSGNTPLADAKLLVTTQAGTRELSAGADGRFLLEDSQVLFTRTASREWSRELTERGTVAVETQEARSEFPVGVLDGESYSRLVRVLQLCDRVLSQIQESPAPGVRNEQLRSLLSDMKSGLREGTLSGSAALVNLSAGDNRRQLEGLSASLERLLQL